MSEKVTFVDEVPRTTRQKSDTKYSRILAQLKSRPMEWALIDEFKDPRTAGQRKWYLNYRKKGWEGVELTTRVLDESCNSQLYARYNPGGSWVAGTRALFVGTEIKQQEDK